MITLAISTYNRKVELTQMATSLKKIMGGGILEKINIRIYDDKSTEYGYKFLKELFPFSEIIIREKNLKADANMRLIHTDFLKTDDTSLIQVDSDVIFHKDFLYEAIFLIDKYKKDKNIFSLYNSLSHKKVSCFNTNYLKKNSIGGICVIFPNREIVKNILNNVLDGKSYDWRWSKYLVENGYNILVSQQSYLQHIGIFGQNSVGNLKIDYGKGFYPTNIEDTIFLQNLQTKILENILINRENLPPAIILKNILSIKNLKEILIYLFRKTFNFKIKQ